MASLKSRFPRFDDKDIILHNFPNGIHNKRTKTFVMLNSSSAMKDEFKTEWFESEYLQSYLHAVNVLTENAEREQKILQNGYRGNVLTLLTFSTPLVTMFLIRHTVELTLKLAAKNLTSDAKFKHGLLGLWNGLKDSGELKFTDTDLKNMTKFVEFLNNLDERGTTFRYATNKNFETKVEEIPLDGANFVNLNKLSDLLNRFVELLVPDVKRRF